MGFDTDDDKFIELLEINTKTGFSKKFNISIKQLKRWDRSEKIQGWINELNEQSNVLKFKKDVDFHFTRKVISEADAARVKLWKQLYEGFAERSIHENPAIAELTKAIKKLAEN